MIETAKAAGAAVCIVISAVLLCYIPYEIVSPMYMMTKFERLSNVQHEIGEGIDACMNAELALHWAYQNTPDDAKRIKQMKDDFCMEIYE